MEIIKISNKNKLHIYHIEEINTDGIIGEILENKSKELESIQKYGTKELENYNNDVIKFIKIMNNKFSPLFLISLCDKLVELLVEKWIVNFPKGTDNSEYKRILDYYSQLK